jgi:hypothetical protein
VCNELCIVSQTLRRGTSFAKYQINKKEKWSSEVKSSQFPILSISHYKGTAAKKTTTVKKQQVDEARYLGGKGKGKGKAIPLQAWTGP